MRKYFGSLNQKEEKNGGSRISKLLSFQSFLYFIAKTNRWSSRTTGNEKAAGCLLISKYTEILRPVRRGKLAKDPGADKGLVNSQFNLKPWAVGVWMTSPVYTTSMCPVLLLNSRAGPVIQAFPSADARDTQKPPGAAVRSRPPPPHLTGAPAAPARRTPGPPRPGRAGSPRPGTAASPAALGRGPRPPSTRRLRRRRCRRRPTLSVEGR